MGCMYDNGDGIKFCPEVCAAPAGANVIVGAVLRAESGFKFVPGERVEAARAAFVPGQRMASVNGEFIPGACIREESNMWQSTSVGGHSQMTSVERGREGVTQILTK